VKNTLGARLRVLREQLHLSQREMEDRLRAAWDRLPAVRGTSPTHGTIARWERGTLDPPAWYVYHLARAAGEDPGWLLTGAGEGGSAAQWRAALEAVRRIAEGALGAGDDSDAEAELASDADEEGATAPDAGDGPDFEAASSSDRDEDPRANVARPSARAD